MIADMQAMPVAAARVAPKTIFIIHPSELLTDHRPHGDGAIAWGFIRELGLRGHRVHVACEEADLAGEIPATVTLHPIRTRARHGVLHTLEYMLRCRLLFERLNRVAPFDLAQQLNPVFSGLSLALAGTRVPIVLGTYVAAWPCDWDGLPSDESPLRHPVKKLLALWQQRRAAALLVTTRAALETRVVDVPEIRSRARRQQHAIDVAAFAPQPAIRDAALASDRILFLANVNGRKGIFVLVDAFARVHAARPSARLVIAGGGTRLDEVRATITARGLDAVTEVLGNVPRADVKTLLQGSALYVLPSYGEPYATTVIEAMAAGLPLVLTNNGGLAELGDAAGTEFVDPGDADALAAGLLAVLNDPVRARAMGDHNLQRAREEFTWSVVADTLEATHDAVARTASARR